MELMELNPLFLENKLYVGTKIKGHIESENGTIFYDP